MSKQRTFEIGRVWFLVLHNFRTEFRQGHALVGLLLFALASVYAAFQAVGDDAGAESWNALVWVVLIFTAFNAISRPNADDRPENRQYLTHVVRPIEWMLARTIYHWGMMTALAGLVLVAFSLFLGTEHLNGGRFWWMLLGLELAGWALASCLTLLAAIAGLAGAGFGLTAVLGLPLVMPIVLVATRFGTDLMSGMTGAETVENLLFLGALAASITAFGLVLFPYLWRD